MGKGGYKEIFLSAQRKAKTNEPVPEDIFTVGTVGTIIQLLRLPDGTVKVLVEGKRRAAIRRFTQTDGFFTVEIEELPERPGALRRARRARCARCTRPSRPTSSSTSASRPRS